jgi:hypothetical protein
VTNLRQNKFISSLYLIVHGKKVECAAVFLGPLGGQVEDEGDPSSLQLVVVAQQVIGRLVLGIEQRQLLVQLDSRHLNTVRKAVKSTRQCQWNMISLDVIGIIPIDFNL